MLDINDTLLWYDIIYRNDMIEMKDSLTEIAWFEFVELYLLSVQQVSFLLSVCYSMTHHVPIHVAFFHTCIPVKLQNEKIEEEFFFLLIYLLKMCLCHKGGIFGCGLAVWMKGPGLFKILVAHRP